MAKKPHTKEEIKNPEEPVEDDSSSIVVRQVNPNIQLMDLRLTGIPGEVLLNAIRTGKSLDIDIEIPETPQDTSETEELTPSFTEGLYGDGKEKRSILDSFLAALGLRE
jgi:hypothetical protein